MGGARIAVAVKSALVPLRRYGLAVWSRDRAGLGWWPSLGTRVARVVTASARGVRAHQLTLQAAALAYYTLFSIVPVLVVALWVLKLFHLIHYVMPEVPAPPEATAAATATQMHVPEANAMLRTALRAILSAVDQAGRLETGIVGLAALAYGVIRQIVHVEKAVNTIAGGRERSPRIWRMLGYLALLALLPALLIVSGLLRFLAHLPVGSTVARKVSWLFDALPVLRSAFAAGVGVGILCLALAIFYASAMRARVATFSTVLGAMVGALLLAAVLWAFAHLQIGAARAGGLQSGMAAVPVFLLWAFSSWLVVLIGAEVAVAHELDCILIHGARRWRLDSYDEQVAGTQIMVEITERTLSQPASAGAAPAAVTTNALARRLRLPPERVRELSARLLRAGLLGKLDGDDYRLACDPDRTALRDVLAAIVGGPGGRRRRARVGPPRHPTLRELAARAPDAPVQVNKDSAPLSDDRAITNWTV